MTCEEIDVDLSLDEVIEQDLADYINSLFHTSRFYFDEAKLINTFGLETVHKYSYYGNPGERCEFFNIYAWYLQNSGYSSFDEFELHRKIMKLWYSGVITGNFAPPGSILSLTGWRISEDRKNIIYQDLKSKTIDMTGCLFWIDYIIRKFIEPNGYFVNGNIVFSKIRQASIEPEKEKVVKIVRNRILE